MNGNGDRLDIVVHQMGRVGSHSIVAALRAHGEIARGRVRSTHRLDRDSVAYERLYWSRQASGLPDSVAHNTEVLERAIPASRPLHVITPFRDPVPRNVSSFFYSLDAYMPEHRDREPTTEELVEAFVTRFNHGEVLRWFTEEIHGPFGIDVYAEPFPTELGWKRCDRGRVKLLVLRHDLPDEIKAERIGELVGVRGLSIPRVNAGAERVTGELYERFLREARLPDDFLEYVYGSRYVRHFFPASEIEAMRARWLGEPAAVA